MRVPNTERARAGTSTCTSDGDSSGGGTTRRARRRGILLLRIGLPRRPDIPLHPVLVLRGGGDLNRQRSLIQDAGRISRAGRKARSVGGSRLRVQDPAFGLGQVHRNGTRRRPDRVFARSTVAEPRGPAALARVPLERFVLVLSPAETLGDLVRQLAQAKFGLGSMLRLRLVTVLDAVELFGLVRALAPDWRGLRVDDSRQLLRAVFSVGIWHRPVARSGSSSRAGRAERCVVALNSLRTGRSLPARRRRRRRKAAECAPQVTLADRFDLLLRLGPRLLRRG